MYIPSCFRLAAITTFAAALLLVVPVKAQSDFGGSWVPLFHEDNPERIPGPELGDYLGIPLSEAGRLRADAYDADRISVVSEYQCRPHGGDGRSSTTSVTGSEKAGHNTTRMPRP